MPTASQKLKTLRKTAQKWSEQQHPRHPKGHPLGGQFASGGSNKKPLFKLNAAETKGFKKLIAEGQKAIDKRLIVDLDNAADFDNLPIVKHLHRTAEKYGDVVGNLMEQSLSPGLEESQIKNLTDRIEKISDKYHRFNDYLNEIKQGFEDRAVDAMAEVSEELHTRAESKMSIDEAISLSAKVIINDRTTKIMSKSAVIGAITNFFQLTNGKASRILLAVDYVADRAHINSMGGMLNIGKGRTIKSFNQMMYHELGHFSELEDSTISDATTNWLKSRAMGSPELLEALIPGSGYDDDEVAYPDKFISPYVGKVYESGITEVVSMGMQHFAYREDMLELYKKDKEHFFLTVGIITRNQD